MTVLEITVQRRGEAGYPVVAELSASGQLPTRAEGLLQLDRVELLALLDPLAYGTLLGQGVLSRGVRDAFVRARAGGDTVHVLLFVEAPELRDLRWERLCAPLDDDRWDFLARDPRVPLSIHLPTATDRRFPPCGRADMRALVLVAAPRGGGGGGSGARRAAPPARCAACELASGTSRTIACAPIPAPSARRRCAR